jgi:hypothetical protein
LADYPVDRSTALDTFLRKQGIQEWRVAVLAANAGVRVYRSGNFIDVSGPTMRLLDGDTVRVVDPPPQNVVSALQAAANTSARDYAFVPGTTPFDKRMAGVMDHRTETIRIDDPLVVGLSDFIRALARDPKVTAPIRHLIVVSHANPEGLLFLKLGMLDPAEVTYEDLEAAVKAKSLIVDPKLLEPRPQDASKAPIPAAFLVRGCRIGTAPAYLQKLKEALGNTMPVIAPKHFHIAAENPRPAGFVEYMGYNFALPKPEPLKDKAAVVAAFKGNGFPRIDGSIVPATSWDGWVPDNPHAAYEQIVVATIINPVTNARETVPGRFRFRLRPLFDAEQSFALPKDPGTEAGRKAAVQAELERVHPQYRQNHPFPEYVRFGYAKMDDFINGWKWKFRYDDKSNTLFFSASRAEYTIIRPITEVADNKLVLNFYPSGRAGSVLALLKVTDTRFFAIV